MKQLRKKSYDSFMKNIIQKLDLDNYIDNFENFFARVKPVAISGDINQHYKYIKALSTIEFPSPKEIPNLDGELNRLKKQAILSLDELYSFIIIITYFNKLKTLSLPHPLSSWINEIEVPDEILATISYFNDEGDINSQQDKELFSLEKAIKQNKIDIKEMLYKLVHSSRLRDYLVDNQIHFNNGEETILVRGGFNNAIKATVIGRSASGFFYIIPQSISHLKEKESILLSKKEEIIYRYCKDISAVFYKWERFLNYVNKEYDRFDHYQARVKFASSNEYQFILPQKTKQVKLSEFAHPAIENPVLINLDLNHKIMLVTGVNAGGKTMLLKSLLGAVYMSKYLLPFKCNPHKTIIGHYKNIEAVIDDPQSVKNDISTFAGRMVEFSKLFAKKDAIVGVDEIELGTDSDEAASLFRVMLEALSKRDITFIITTHHKRLASLMGADDSVSLIAALYDEERRLPTYTFLQGSIGKSYAFETAQRYGVPENIVANAKIVHGEDNERLNELIEKSTSLEREMRAKIKEVDETQNNLKKKEQYLLNQQDILEDNYKKRVFEMESRYNEAINIARDALKVQESTEGRRLLTEAHKSKSIKDKTEKPLQPKIPLKLKDKIKYRSHRGELIGIRGKDATILVDGMKMRVPLSELKKSGNLPKQKVKKSKVNIHIQKGNAGVSIKLLGMYGDEAIDSVDKFLSDALVNGLNEVQIIHGTGGGILAKLVAEYLSSHPKINKYYRMSGNLGITVVEL